MSAYLVPAAAARAELRERGSRFLALLEPVADETAAKARLAAIEAAHRDATHCCWAWRLGSPLRERCSDAGEPGGTAGPPILRALQTAAQRFGERVRMVLAVAEERLAAVRELAAALGLALHES